MRNNKLMTMRESQDKLWLTGYISTILLPFGLIFCRGFAEICLALIILLFLLRSFISKNFEWIHDPVFIVASLAWVWVIFISIFSYNPYSSFAMALPWIRYILLYSAMKNWILVRQDTIYFLSKILAIMIFLIIIDTLWQYVFGVSLSGHIREDSGRLTGPFDNVKVGIFLAKMLIPSVGSYLFLMNIKKNHLGIAAGIILIFLTVATILLTGERTAFASTLIAIFTGSALLSVCEARFRKILFIGSTIIIFTSIALIKTQVWVQERAKEFYDTISNYPTTEYGQLEMGGILIGQRNLLMGGGLNSFRSLCPDLIASGQVTTCNLHPHNLYIEWFAGAGVLGLILFVILVLLLFNKAIKEFMLRRRAERLVPLVAISTLIVNFFPFMPTQSVFSNWPSILLWYSVSVAMASMNVLNENKYGT